MSAEREARLAAGGPRLHQPHDHRRPRAAGASRTNSTTRCRSSADWSSCSACEAELLPDVRDKVQKIGAQSNRSAGMMREFVAFARRDDDLDAIDVQRAIEHALTLRRYHLSRARIDVAVTRRPSR